MVLNKEGVVPFLWEGELEEPWGLDAMLRDPMEWRASLKILNGGDSMSAILNDQQTHIGEMVQLST
jgi:hypothetical protein